MHPSKLPGEVFRGLAGTLQEITISGKHWWIAPGRAGEGFIGVSEDAGSTTIAVWPGFPKEGEQPTLEITFSTAKPLDWAPVDSKMNTGFAKGKYGVHWLAYAVLVDASHIASTGRVL